MILAPGASKYQNCSAMHAPVLAGRFGWSLISTLWSPWSSASAGPQIFHLHCFWEVEIYSISLPRQIKLMRDKRTKHHNAKSKESFQCQVFSDFPLSLRCLQGDFFVIIFIFFSPNKPSAPSQCSREASLSSWLWNRVLGTAPWT